MSNFEIVCIQKNDNLLDKNGAVSFNVRNLIHFKSELFLFLFSKHNLNKRYKKNKYIFANLSIYLPIIFNVSWE
jgi:hypothetical protein